MAQKTHPVSAYGEPKDHIHGQKTEHGSKEDDFLVDNVRQAVGDPLAGLWVWVRERPKGRCVAREREMHRGRGVGSS